jgi:N-acetyl-anhydromuramyl-L-alanine amidase AmpD
MATRRKTTKFIVVHVTATPPSRSYGMAELTRDHKARGFSGPGYQYLIRRNGAVETGRPEAEAGAHVRGFNSVSIGISLEGGVDARGKAEDNRTDAQNHALVALIKDLLTRYPDAKVCGHRDLSPDRDGDGVIEPHEYLKECPCFDAIPWAQANGLPAASIKGTWEVSAPQRNPDARTVYLQKLLKRSGYEFGPVDGIMGPKTRAALRRYQAAAGLPESGLFDEKTVHKLRTAHEQPIIDTVREVAQKDLTVKRVPPVQAKSTADLRAAGSRTIKSADKGMVAMGLGALGVFTQASGEVKKALQGATDLVPLVLELWPILVTAFALAVAFYLFRHVQAVRVEDYHDGSNISYRPGYDYVSDAEAVAASVLAAEEPRE